MPRVVHFEIHANDPEKVAAFYGNVFGWQIRKWDGPAEYWLIMTGTPGRNDEVGIDGGIFRRKDAAQGEKVGPNAYICTVDVSDHDAYAARIQEHGGSEIVEKKAVPGVGWQSYHKDPDGNIFCIMQSDGAAK